jgi:hypothetical protein
LLLSDYELLARILEVDDRAGRLCSRERTVFESMRAQDYPLTQPQLDWIRGVGERLGIQTAPARNSFSALTPERQAEHRKRAASVKLPWERGDVTLPKKPPGR